MIGVALVEGLSCAPAKEDNPQQIDQRDGQNQQGD
jgi:hypothetical protein